MTYISDRFQDVQNAQLLPNFCKCDVGLALDVMRLVSRQASVDTITNTIGLTERNPGTLVSQGEPGDPRARRSSARR